jgi:hypothetical protein
MISVGKEAGGKKAPDKHGQDYLRTGVCSSRESPRKLIEQINGK